MSQEWYISSLNVFEGCRADESTRERPRGVADIFLLLLLQVAKAVLSGARAGSLVLMDEMGSGTDPMQGAALAQSLLEV